jgi:glycosyltransferase involved in cell wall biosynthesis
VFKSKALRGILSKQFDVIHYHNISLVGGPRVLEYGEAIKLYTMHEYWLVCPTHVLFKYNREPCQSRQCFLCSLTYRRPPQWWRHTGLLERAVRHVDAFIAPARFSGEIQRKMGLDVPIVHLPPFVGTSEASSSPEAPSSARPYFLYAGRLERLKGVQTLIPIFKRYRKAELVIAGGGSLEGELKREAEGCSNIRFVGVVDQQQLGSLYMGAVALIVPSICYEVFPLVIIEAFREGTPALVRNIGGMPEIIQESGGGAAFRTDEELIERMDSLLADPAARKELGACGRQAYLQKWTADAHIPRYLDLISEIAARKPGYAPLPACFSRREPT